MIKISPLPVGAQEANRLEKFGITPGDLAQLAAVGKPLAAVEQELSLLTATEISYPRVIAPATLSNSYLRALPLSRVGELLESFATQEQERRFAVPAAGAASRQFQLLRLALTTPEFASAKSLDDYLRVSKDIVEHPERYPQSDLRALLPVIKEIERELPRFWNEGVVKKQFAFLDDLAEVMQAQGLNLETEVANGNLRLVADYILKPEGLNYGFLPKVLMRLHAYNDPETGKLDCRLALEEHIRTVAEIMATSPQSAIKLHFFISPEHEALFRSALRELQDKQSLHDALSKYNCTLRPDGEGKKFDISYDFQGAATDSVSVEAETSQVLRTKDGKISLRKAGHGALLENVSGLNEAGVWLQNVDNVLYDNPQIKALVVIYKRVLAAYASELEVEAHQLIKGLITGLATEDTEALKSLNRNALDFITQDLMTKVSSESLNSASELDLAGQLIKLLDRPIVVAGYVPLEPGQAGGGPFVIEVDLSGVSVQKVNTVEGSEFQGGQANSIFKTGEFFNPVDLYITRQRYDGSLFSLGDCVDQSRAFISSKPDKETGKLLRAYERPGLWNGSLAKAFQVSVAMPSHVFSAIKTVAGAESFLSPRHQPYSGPSFCQLDLDRGVLSISEKSQFEELVKAQRK